MNAQPVYVVEDDPIARRTLERQLRRLGRDCRIFEDSAAFLEATQALLPGIVMLDLHLPGKSGLEVLDEVAGESGPFAFVVLSASEEVNDAIGAFRRGVVDFLRKPCPFDRLADVLRNADAAVAAKLSERQRREMAAGVRLSQRERQVLDALSRGLHSKTIAHEFDISVRTVEMHRSNVIAKLKAQSTPHALAIANELGLI